MTLTLELPPELESELAAEAARLRLPFEEYVLRILAVGRPPDPMPPPAPRSSPIGSARTHRNSARHYRRCLPDPSDRAAEA